ncbi:hypothetical protein ABPG73_007544, partial [Tetrahymena malaccensis]
YNQIKDQGSNSLGNSLALCSNLMNLDLWISENQIGNQGLYDICKALSKKINLINLELHLNENRLDQGGLQNLTQCFSSFIHLKMLKFDFIGKEFTQDSKNKMKLQLLKLKRLVKKNINIY